MQNKKKRKLNLVKFVSVFNLVIVVLILHFFDTYEIVQKVYGVLLISDALESGLMCKLSLPVTVLDPLVGDMLGDGHIGFSYKCKDGNLRSNYNARFQLTMSKHNLPYLLHLRNVIYKSLLTKKGGLL